MAKIDLSPAWQAAMIPRLFRLTNGNDNYKAGVPNTLQAMTSANTGLLNAGLYSALYNTNYGAGVAQAAGVPVAVIHLMKGVPPTSFDEIPTISSRSADILCSFCAGGDDSGDFINSQVNVNPVMITTKYNAAVNSGTCTWFWWATVPRLGGNNATIANLNNGAQIMHNAYGTVGVAGSGADLEMEDTNLILNEQYRITGLQLRIPINWTY